jgi:short-subunit dehydrogenase
LPKVKLIISVQKFYTNKIILITGGTSGIGYALAQLALEQNAKVAVCARSLAKLQAMAKKLNTDHLFTFQADVSQEDQCHAFVQASIEHFGAIDILINNAGISMRALFQEVESSVLKQVMDINYWGSIFTTKSALHSIIASKGTIVGISSIAGYKGLPGRVAYSSSKFALQGFLESLRIELLHTGVNVMWVSPGFTASNIRNTALDQSGQAQGETPLKEDKLMSAEECARIILQAISKRKRTVIMTFQGKLTVLLNKFFPSLVDKLVYNHFKKEPDSPLK